MYDAIVIGGGFYGTTIAEYLSRNRGLADVLLVESEPNLLARASYRNQARIHNGYHYPRSFTTAFRSRMNVPRFVQNYSDAIKKDFIKLYAIARKNSKVTALQFRRFCREIGADLDVPPKSLKCLFEPALIEEVFLAQEYVFNANILAEIAKESLLQAGVEVKLRTSILELNRRSKNLTALSVDSDGSEKELEARLIFNCSYSGLNQFEGLFKGTKARLKHELTEMALIRLPSLLDGLGITVMDGPFFSLMPFPARNLNTLSHVRYTPHYSWEDNPGLRPIPKMTSFSCQSRSEWMFRDVARYLPAIREAQYVESLFEVKTTLKTNEGDDGRPILFESHPELPGVYSVLGGKIDNIYDVLELINTVELR